MANLAKTRFGVAPGRLAFGSVTGSYVTLLAATGSVRKLLLTNSLDKETIITLDGGTTDFIYLPASTGLLLDFDISLQYSGTVQVKHNGVAPTVGAISAGIVLGG